MNKEIKEILEMLRKYGSTNDKVLLDYITNLQNQLEEKTYLYNKLDTESKYVVTNLQKRLDFMVDRNDQKQERINKAIEYINSNECCEEWELDGNMVQDNILKILKGEE